MKTNKKKLEDTKISVKLKLAALWTVIMSLYIYADFFSLYQPGEIEEIIAELMGPFPVTQSSILMASILMIIPAIMIFLSLALKSKYSRWTNIIIGAIYIVVDISNLVDETWIYYIIFGIVEIIITLLIVWYAVRWPRSVDQS